MLFLVAGCAISAQENLAHFKLLLIIRPDVNVPELSLVGSTLSQEAIEALTFNYLDELPWLVDSITGGMVTVETSVVVSNRPITSLGGGTGGYYLGPEGCYEDIQEFSSPAQYDCIQVVYSLANLPHAAWGLTFPGSCYIPATNYSGFCTVENFNTPSDYYDRSRHISEVFLHEWIHTLENYYYDVLHVTSRPDPGHLDAAGALCYENLLQFYADHLTGNLFNYCDDPPTALPGTGFGAQAYEWPVPHKLYGSIIDTLVYSDNMNTHNMLLNPSFEELDNNNFPLHWSKWSFFSTPAVITATQSEYIHGSNSLYIKNNPMDLTNAHQTISGLTPNELYLFVGNIKTNNAEAHEGGHHTAGAFILDHGDDWGSVSQIMGTHNWKRMIILYNAGNRDFVNVNCAMGWWSSAATGEAWFDDLWFGKLSDVDMVAPIGIKETAQQETTIRLYQNSGYLIAEQLNGQFNEMRIYDIMGRLLKSANIEKAYNTSIAINDLPQGVLIVNFKGNKTTQAVKFVNMP